LRLPRLSCARSTSDAPPRRNKPQHRLEIGASPRTPLIKQRNYAHLWHHQSLRCSATGFNRNNGPLMDLAMTILGPVSRSPQKGADTLVWLATSPDVANVSGGYFIDQQQRPPGPEAEDTETAGRLWEISERQCAVSGRSAEARS
jgi:hypothetical protein